VPNRLSRQDVSDLDFVDGAELAATGAATYRTGVVVVSTTSVTKRVVLLSGSEIIRGDDPVEVGDKTILAGSVAAGIYTVAAIIDNETFDVVESISNSTGGTASFRYAPGAFRVGFDPTGQIVTVATNVQDAIKDVAVAVASGGVSASTHRTLRQLIHLADTDGPLDGFASGAYAETLPVGSSFPTSTTWYEDNTMVKKIFKETITYNGNKTFNTVKYEVFDTDGVTVLAGETALDTYDYSGGNFLTPKITRTIS
jgi:hypothetical protein